MKELFSFLKDLESKAGIILLTALLCLSIYVTFQVTNHIPTQIKEVNTKIDNNHKELKQEIRDLNKRFDDIYNILFDIKKQVKI